MKKIFIFSLLSISFLSSRSQQDQSKQSQEEFTKQISTARSAYSAGKLDDARFAMQQMLQDIDMVVGREILKILPKKLDDKDASIDKDNVSGASNAFGVVIHREYGAVDKSSSIEIINNSPLASTFNSMLSLPFFANTADNKLVKLTSGYKGILQRSENSLSNSTAEQTEATSTDPSGSKAKRPAPATKSGNTNNTAASTDPVYDYDLQVPINNNLITIRIPSSNEEAVKRIANSLPIDQIAKLMK